MIGKFKKLPLEKQLVWSFFLLASFVIALTMTISVFVDIRSERRQIDNTIGNIAEYVASLDSVVDMLEKGWNGENFSEVTNNLRNSDPYMVLADFKDYRRAQHTVQELYKQKQTWNRMSLMNISNAGIFSADRSIMDYSRDIWGATPVK